MYIKRLWSYGIPKRNKSEEERIARLKRNDMEEQVTREEFEKAKKKIADLEKYFTGQLRYTNQRMDDIRDDIRKDYINALERMTWGTPLLMAIIAIILAVCSLLLPGSVQ